ncbi:hypothetical protein PTKIN_Ptkin16aG0055600 [Pterospermum kingtungense]
MGVFEHRAGSGGSIGALEYVLHDDGCKLIVASSNAKDDLNTVYNVFLEGDANWREIKERLDISGNISIFNGPEIGLQHSPTVYIDKTSPTPTLRAIVKDGAPAPLPYDEFITVKPKMATADVEAGESNGVLQGMKPTGEAENSPENVNSGSSAGDANGAQPGVVQAAGGPAATNELATAQP